MAGRVRTAVKAAFADLSLSCGFGEMGWGRADLKSKEMGVGVAGGYGGQAGGVSKSFQHIS